MGPFVLVGGTIINMSHVKAVVLTDTGLILKFAGDDGPLRVSRAMGADALWRELQDFCDIKIEGEKTDEGEEVQGPSGG